MKTDLIIFKKQTNKKTYFKILKMQDKITMLE